MQRCKHGLAADGSRLWKYWSGIAVVSGKLRTCEGALTNAREELRDGLSLLLGRRLLARRWRG